MILVSVFSEDNVLFEPSQLIFHAITEIIYRTMFDTSMHIILFAFVFICTRERPPNSE